MNNSFPRRILAWYDQHARQLPWRSKTPNPYHVWLSEIMLQQTTVTAVIPYFSAFIERFPSVHSLAEATLEEVLLLWQGLGYYGRAKRLWLSSKLISEKGFPTTLEGWQALPGIGPYTAAALCAILYEHDTMALDGNIIRILSRQTMKSVATNKIFLKEHFWTDHRHGDFIQALMDLGSSVCKPKNPHCTQCPVHLSCLAYQKGVPHVYPLRPLKKEKPKKEAHALILQKEDGALWLCKKTAKGLLQGLYGTPLQESAPLPPWQCVGVVRHTFTHFDLQVFVWKGGEAKPTEEGGWIKNPESVPLSTLMKKILRCAKDEGPHWKKKAI